MRKLILKMSMSIDAFVGGPNGELDWLFKSMNDKNKAHIYDNIVNAGVHIMGSKTFYDMKAYWPFSNDLLAAPMNDIPKVIFTKKGLDPTRNETTNAIKDAINADMAKGEMLAKESDKLQSWDDATVAQGDIAEEIRKLKAQPGNFVLAHGGAGFAQSLVKTGLIDEYQFMVHPVMLGQGLPIFSKLESPKDLQLISSTPLYGGVIANVYRPLEYQEKYN